MDRREFLKLMASAGLGLALSQTPLRRLVQRYPVEPRLTHYEEAFKTAACGLCPAGCSLRVRLVNGVAVQVAGNPLDPLTGGGICPKGLMLLQQVYHPDRLKRPLKRTGPPGYEHWSVVEWDEALDEIAKRLKEIRSQFPERIFFLNGRPFGLMYLLVDRWMQFLGSPHHLADHYRHAYRIATRAMMGQTFEPAWRLSELDLVVSVGDAFLDYTLDPVYTTREYASFRQRPGRMRGELILFDDTLGITAEKADAFHRIEPGSHAAVLLALANVIVRYEWYDKAFVESHTEGFESWRDRVVYHYPPEYVERLCGVPAPVFYETARRLVRAQRKVVTAGIPAMMGPGGLHTAMAMLALNALLGTIDRDLRFEPAIDTLVQLPPLSEKKALQKAALRLDTQEFPLAEDVPWVLPQLLEQQPDAVQALFLYYSNPLASHPDGERWRKVLEKIPLIVSFSPFMDETSAYAHWILPESTVLERYQEFVHPPIAGVTRITVTQPIGEEPLYDTRPVGDVLLDLVKRVDEAAQDEFPWDEYVDFMEDSLVQIYALKTGTVFLPANEFRAFSVMVERGFWETPYEDEDAFLEAIYEKGGWVQPVYIANQWGRLFRTRSRKFEFDSSFIRERLHGFMERTGKSLTDLGLGPILETYSMPNYIPDTVSLPAAKLVWLVTWNTGSTTELPWWWEVMGMHRYIQWQMWAETGTRDIEKARLDTAKRYSIRLQIGPHEFSLRAVYRYGGHPAIVVLPTGFGRQVPRSTPLPEGRNVLQWSPYRPDPLTGLPAYYVPVKKVDHQGGNE